MEISNTKNIETKTSISKYILILPLVFVSFLLVSVAIFANEPDANIRSFKNNGFFEYLPNSGNSENSSKKYNILSDNDVSVGLKDTVYTDKDCWLELRIDQQMLYQHWRNGNIDKYPISSGNKYLDRSIESRPGLFAIFLKEERHESSQYNNAEMFYFMPFNQGIGFHSLNGTGYYGNLGVRPSSHGCIRMRHEDVKKVFRDCPLGTLVLAHKGTTARIVGFAPEGYVNNEELPKDEEKFYLANNLYNILEGNYYISERKFFVVNPKSIPVSGMYIGYDVKLPEKQKTQKNIYLFFNEKDRFANIVNHEILDSAKSAEFLAGMNYDDDSIAVDNNKLNLSSAEMIKKYFHNPIGILPYFPPKNKE